MEVGDLEPIYQEQVGHTGHTGKKGSTTRWLLLKIKAKSNSKDFSNTRDAKAMWGGVVRFDSWMARLFYSFFFLAELPCAGVDYF